MLGAQGIEVFSHRVGKRASGLQHGVHVSKLALNELKLANALAELLALVDVGNDVVHHRLHDAQRPAGQHRALVVQPAHQHLGALVQAAEHIGQRHFNVVKHQLARVAAAHAELVELLRHRETGHAFFNQKGRDATCAELGLALGVDHQRVGVRAVGDPHLASVEQVVAAFVFSAQLHAQHVAARTGLAHGQRAHVFAADEFGQVLAALLGRAVALDLVDAQIAVRAVRQTHAGAGARNFFHGDHVRQIAHVGAAVFLAHGDAEHAQAAHFLPQVHGELVVLVDLSGARCDLGLCKFAHRVAQGVDVFAKLKVQAGQIVHEISLR